MRIFRASSLLQPLTDRAIRVLLSASPMRHHRLSMLYGARSHGTSPALLRESVTPPCAASEAKQHRPCLALSSTTASPSASGVPLFSPPSALPGVHDARTQITDEKKVPPITWIGGTSQRVSQRVILLTSDSARTLCWPRPSCACLLSS